MYYFKPKVNIIFIKLTVVFCCLLYCRSKANGGRGGAGGEEGRGERKGQMGGFQWVMIILSRATSQKSLY
jgi:hypothetical protein